jgi:hypothetical protein
LGRGLGIETAFRFRRYCEFFNSLNLELVWIS